MSMQAKNKATGECFAEKVETARTFFKRLIGLLGRANLPERQGLYFPKCSSIHTFFMRFPIDILFLDKDLTITKAVNCLQPNRIAFGPGETRDALELTCGTLAKFKLGIGDQIRLVEPDREGFDGV